MIHFYRSNAFYQWCKKLSLLLLMAFYAAAPLTAQTLVWEENFNGSTINPETWTFDFGDGCERGICGWGNQELQYYTSRPENAYIEDGSLVIEARRENFQNKAFTSARLKTVGRVQFKYGTLEARIKVPDMENGLWPAFWMLGATGNWPASGEIDIMEMGNAAAIQANLTNRRVGAATHWENNNSHASYGTHYDSPVDMNDDYHLYKMTWDSEFIRVYVDDIEFYAINIAAAAAADLEEFHQAHYILLNLAVGGTYTGITNAAGITAPLPAKMYVDYIKLYQNPGDELYLGTENALAGNYGVYSESPILNDQLTYGQDAELYLWNNLNPIADAAPYEGNEVLALRANAGNWFGFGVESKRKNLLNFADGYLNFHFKTTYNGQFKVGVVSGHGESWVDFPPGAEQYGLQRDGEWHQVSIPLSTFNNPGMGMHIDLGSMAQLFMFAGDAPGATTDFYIDNIYYSGGVAANPAPVVSITAPTTDAEFNTGEPIEIIATASDENGTVSKVDFYNGNVLLGTATSEPYSFSWTDAPAGVYTLIAKATDNEGGVGTSGQVRVFVAAPDNQAPTISITAPAAGATFIKPATIAITANAADADGSVYKVEFFNGETLLSTDFTSPYSYNWNVTTPGEYSITARVTDNGNLQTTSAPVKVTVADNAIVADQYGIFTDNADISQKLRLGVDAHLYLWDGTLSAIQGATPYEGSNVLAVRASPSAANWFGMGIANDIRNLQHFAGGTLKFHMKTTSTNTFRIGINTANGDSWIDFVEGQNQWGLVRNGEWHEVSIPMAAFPNKDLSHVAQIFMFSGGGPNAVSDFYFDHIYLSSEAAGNTAPSVSISAPANNASFTAPANITITANASDVEGTVSRVEFYNGEDLLGSDASAPFSFSWNEVAAGTYTLRAKAFDNEGLEASSAPVTITVEEATATGPNLALNKPVTVSSVENGGTPGAAAVDGDLNTRWSSEFSDPQWLAVDLGTTYNIDQVKITWEPAYATHYEIQVSDDGDSWTSVKTISGNSTLENNHTQLGASGRYVRIFGTQRALPYGYSIYELEVYGSEPAEYCATVAGSYSFSAVTEGDNVTFTFHPLGDVVGGDLAIIYISESEGGGYPGYGMTKNSDGDFTFTKAIPTGTVTSIYFTWQIGEGGLQDNSSANPHTYTVGASCGDGGNGGGGNEPGDYCDTAENGHFALSATTANGLVTFTFHPLEPIAGSNFALIYIKPAADPGPPPGYVMTASGTDFVHSIPAPAAGTELSIYFTYRTSENGPEANSSANPMYYVVGSVCGEAENVAPTVSITSPESYSMHSAMDDILIEAEAADEDGTISRVEFYSGDELLGTADTAPYSYLWTSVPDGTYSLTAVAYDDQELSTTSEAVNITVNCVTKFYADADGDGWGDGDDFVVDCEAPAGYVARDGDCNDGDASINPDAADLCDGIDRNCDGSLRQPMDVPVITVTPAKGEYTGGDAKTIYLGYGPQSVTLAAATTQAATYSWSQAGNTVSTNASYQFRPSAAGIYTFTVTAKNGDDCTESSTETIMVIDARFNKKANLILVCHNGQTVPVDKKSIQVHLAHGDRLGGCDDAVVANARIAGPAETELTVYPNPAGAETHVSFYLGQGERFNVAVHDLRGALVKTIASGAVQQKGTYTYTFTAADLAKGVYLVKLVSGSRVATVRLVVQQ